MNDETVNTEANKMITKWNKLKGATENSLTCMDHKCAPYIMRAILQGYGLFIPWDEEKLTTSYVQGTSESRWFTWIDENFNNIEYYKDQSICSLVQAPVQEQKYNFDKINDRENINPKYLELYDELMKDVFNDDKSLPYLHYSDFIKGQSTSVIDNNPIGFGCPQYSFSYDDSCNPPSTSVRTLDADKIQVIFNPSNK